MNATSKDSVRSYLTEIGRIPLLTLEQEIILGKQVQRLSFLYSIKEKLKVALDREPTRKEWAERANCSMPTLERDLALGKQAKDRLIAANLRLVVSIAKKYQNRGLDFLDLIQEGNTGLITATEKFDPKKGYKFSTYAYWWIRQAIIRGIRFHNRVIRLPHHVYDAVYKIKKTTNYLSQKKG